MRIRMFGHYLQFGLLLLWAIESFSIFASSWIASELTGEPVSNAMTPWIQALVLAAFVLLSMISMGLLSQRLRDGMAGVALRIIMSVVAGSIIGTMVLALMPEHRPPFTQVLQFALF